MSASAELEQWLADAARLYEALEPGMSRASVAMVLDVLNAWPEGSDRADVELEGDLIVESRTVFPGSPSVHYRLIHRPDGKIEAWVKDARGVWVVSPRTEDILLDAVGRLHLHRRRPLVVSQPDPDAAPGAN